jgi:hypothetical protein
MWSELNLEQMAREENSGAVTRTPEEVEQMVIMTRLELHNRSKPCGPKAIRTRLREHYVLNPLPGGRTIGLLLAKYGLTHTRTGHYAGNGSDRLQTRSHLLAANRRCEQSTVVL